MTPTLAIGPLQRAHRARIEEIVRATGVFNADEVNVALELFDEGCGLQAAGCRQPAARDPQPDYEFVGAFEGETLVGYACFGLTPSTDRTYDLYWIAVHPEAQHSGAGAALMNEVERALAERRARLLIIETSSREDYAPTRRFYHKRGYAEAARMRGFYAPEDDRIVLAKRIAGFARADRPPIAPVSDE